MKKDNDDLGRGGSENGAVVSLAKNPCSDCLDKCTYDLRGLLGYCSDSTGE